MEQEEEERTMGCLTIKLRCMNALPSLLHWETMLYHFTVKSQFKQQDYLSFFFGFCTHNISNRHMVETPHGKLLCGHNKCFDKGHLIQTKGSGKSSKK